MIEGVLYILNENRVKPNKINFFLKKKTHFSPLLPRSSPLLPPKNSIVSWKPTDLPWQNNQFSPSLIETKPPFQKC